MPAQNYANHPPRVPDATIDISDDQLDSITEFAAQLRDGGGNAEGMTLLVMCAAALFQELRDRRRAMAAIQRLAAIDHTFEVVQGGGK